MGETLEKLIGKAGDMEVAYGIDPRVQISDGKYFKSIDDLVRTRTDLINTADVYVDFTQPDSVIDNVGKISQAGVDSIIGTTGWYDRLGEVRDMAAKYGRRILYAPNFSLGINAFLVAVETVAGILVERYGYDALVYEVHHTGKKDAPSGTAIETGKILETHSGRRMVHVRRGKREVEEIDVLGGRVGKVAGHHQVWFTPKDPYAERLIIEHDAFTPEVFGLGVLEAIRWMMKKNKIDAGLYTFKNDVLRF
jgi:4-hydroxy-tetrahydrodipicolinate reductase